MRKISLFIFSLVCAVGVAQTPCVNGMAGNFPCDGYDLQSQLTLNQLNSGFGNDSWGWTDPLDSKEYALVGLDNGTAFIDISDPINPVYLGKLPTHTQSSIWRDIKVYNNYAFVVSEAGGHGMQVFDLTRLRSVANPPETFTEDAHYDGFGSAHNLVINEDTGYAYGVGTQTFNGGPHFVNIQDPLNPTGEGGFSPDGYTHDAQVVTYNGPDTDYTGQELFFGSNADELVIVDITDKSNPVHISNIAYTNVAYTHQGWFTEDQRYFILGDEVDEINFGFNTKTIILDFNDLDNPQHHFDYTGPTPASDHNGYVVGNTYYMASYRAGMRALDISDIANGTMTESGYFDTHPESNDVNTNNGAWNVYPFFGSGNLVISDEDRGFLLVKASALDTTDPVAICQDITVPLGANGEVIVDPNNVDNGSSDDSGFFTATLDTNNFDCSNIGTNNVVLTITDPSGNTDTCSAVITVVDDMDPEITCPADVTVGPDAGETYFTLPDYVALNEATGTDNCLSPISISQDPAAGTQLADGTHTISFESTDPSNNVGTCSFVLTVDESLGLGENDVPSFEIYPNPTSNLINVISKNQTVQTIVIHDMLGKELFSSSSVNSEQVSIDISGYSKGMYFLTINNSATKKIIKE